MQSPADFWLQDSPREKMCVCMCVCVFMGTVEKEGNRLERNAESHFTCTWALWCSNRGIRMQIQQSPGCHHLPISCIWFWWVLKDCVSRWGGMSEGYPGCHGQESAACVQVFPRCCWLEWCWPAKIKALLSLTDQRNWFWSCWPYISENISVTTTES